MLILQVSSINQYLPYNTGCFDMIMNTFSSKVIQIRLNTMFKSNDEWILKSIFKYNFIFVEQDYLTTK